MEQAEGMRWGVRVVVLGVVVWGVWEMVGLHVMEPRGEIGAARAEWITGLRVPGEARNIRAAHYGQWVEYATYLRFEAPTDVCLRYAATVVDGPVVRRVEAEDLAMGERLIRPGALEDFSWFDLAKGEDV